MRIKKTWADLHTYQNTLLTWFKDKDASDPGSPHWYNPSEDFSSTKKGVSWEMVPKFEEQKISFGERLAAARLVPAYQLFRRARMVKSPAEVARLERAARIAEAGIAAVLAMLAPGVTERDAVRAYESEVVRQGASPYFSVITLGERAALADVYPGDRALRPGDLVRFDLGCVWEGYRSDISRTAVLGAPSDKQARYYAAALAGERAAIEAMKPGVPASRLFDVAVRATRAAGIPHYQRHHVGHGIGLEPYDPPTLAPGSDTVLEPGMVFCVETPYYEHGWGGVQVEDAVEVTAAGARMLTRSSRELALVG